MATGGYKIIDFKNYNFTAGGSTTIPGIYEAIENNYGKMLLASGVVTNGVERPAMPIGVTHTDNQYIFVIYSLSWTITNEDLVSTAALGG